jgi:outer membrane receptor protein involved in Fe transport
MRSVAVALLLVGLAARADSMADEADFRFQRAAKLYRQGKVEEALGEFLASNRLVRNRNVIFNIARSFEVLKHYNEAYRWYTEILADDMPEADRKELAAAMKRLQPSLALLRVQSQPPGATVYVDRKDLGARGQTPVVLALPAGAAQVMVELPGFRPVQARTQLTIGQTVELNPALELIYGAVALEGEPPGFEVRVDDGPALALQMGSAQVVPGRHVLTISAPGHASQQISVEVAPGGVTPVKFKLSPLPPPAGVLVVRANLDGALVRIDGKEAGFTPGVIDNVAQGAHRVEILAEGREPVVQQVYLSQNQRSFLDARLPYAMPRVVAAEKELTRAQDAPASVTVISAEEIRGFGYTTLTEALRPVRGLYTNYDRQYETLGVRGFSSPGTFNSRILVLSDGHITNDGAIGQGYVGHDFDVDLSQVERIEVVRGPGSVLYGSAAFFAVINVVHRTPAIGFHGEAGGMAGTLGENSGHAIFSAAREDAWAWARAGALDMSGETAFISPLDSAVARNLDAERAGHVDLRARAGELSLAASFNSRRKTLPTGAYLTIFGAPNTYVRDQRGFVEAQYNHAFVSGLALDARASYDGLRYNGSWQYIGRPLGVLGSDSNTVDWLTGELRLRLPAMAGHRIFVGGELQDRWRVYLNAVVPRDLTGRNATHFSNYDDGLGAPDANAPNAELVMSAYAGDDWRISSRAQLDVAVRVDKYLDNYPANSGIKQLSAVVNPRVALLLQPYDSGHSKLIFGRAFRNPGFYERYFNDGGVSQVAPDPSNPLRPEVVYTGELEHTHQFSDELSLIAAAYLSEMRNLIRVGSPAGNDVISQYQNRPFKVHAAGGEVELRWQAGPGWLFSGWYSYSVVRDDGEDDGHGNIIAEYGFLRGRVVPNSPAHTGAVRALFPVVAQTLSFSTELTWCGPRHAIRNDDGTDGAELGETLFWNVGLSGEFVPWRLRYGAFVYNVLNQRPSLPAGPEVVFPNHAIPQYGRMLRLMLSASF